MVNPIHRTDIFHWKTSKTKTPGRVNNESKPCFLFSHSRVEKASEFAVAEVFSIKKPCAQSILSEWMNQKLRLELEMDDDEEEEEMEESKPNPIITLMEEKNSGVHSFIQDLMETGVITIEVCHKQVKENRMRRDAEREKLRKEKETLREVREEAWQLEKEKQQKKRQEARRQEELIQQEMIHIRREMEEKRSLEQLAHNMERGRLQKQRAIENSLIPKHHNSTQKKQNKDLQLKLKKLEAKVHLLDLQVRRHYSFILRVRMGKAEALCDWRRQLRAWQSWRALVWARTEEKEAERTEEELRQEHRRCQQAVESDRRRLLRHCLSDWRVWCQVEHHRKELLQQQEETRRKMAAQMKAAEEERLRAEEEEKQKEVERKKEEKMQQRKVGNSKQKRAEREHELSELAAQHYLRTLLLHQGVAPWKRLLDQSHVNTQVSATALQRRCFCSWLQFVDEAHADRETSANQLYHRILLQRVVCSWKRLKDLRFILEAHAEQFHRTQTQKVFMALLDHAREERIRTWDNEQRGEAHNSRRAVKKCFAGWRHLPVVLQEEKEREARREQLRRKVAEILPDFRY
uniref:Coiled-coil domain containing 191 n=1 Tax=Cyprinus carpio TaxID=7962 RepID=A0A8C1YL79_CYPCA